MKKVACLSQLVRAIITIIIIVIIIITIMIMTVAIAIIVLTASFIVAGHQ